MHSYQIYGLSVQSDVEFPEAFTIEKQKKYDAYILYENEEEPLNTDLTVGMLVYGERKSVIYMSKGEMLFIKEGKYIKYNDIARQNMNRMREIILGDGFGQLLYQRGIFCIHGSAMYMDGRTIAITGKSGAGKSTLAVALRQAGAEFMADDTVAIGVEGNIVYAYPGYPQQKLCENAVKELNYNINDLIPITETRNKYALRLTNEYHNKRERLNVLIIIEPYDGDTVRISEITGGEKLSQLINSSYVYKIYKMQGISTQMMMQCIQIVQEIRVLLVNRPKIGDTTKEQILCIERTLHTKYK